MRSWITPSRRPAALLAVTLAGLAAPLLLLAAEEAPRRPCGGTGPTGPGRAGHPSLGRPPAAP
jgi:hypothetical protein